MFGERQRLTNLNSPGPSECEGPWPVPLYDILGRETSRTDALGHIQTTAHDPLDRVIGVGGDTYPLATGYDTMGRKTSGATTRDDGETWDGTLWMYDPATGLCTLPSRDT